MAYACVLFLLVHFYDVYRTFLNGIKKTRWPLSFALDNINKILIPNFSKEKEMEFLKNLSDDKKTVCIWVLSDKKRKIRLSSIYFYLLPLIFIIFTFSLIPPESIPEMIVNSIMIYFVGLFVSIFCSIFLINLAYHVANSPEDEKSKKEELLKKGAEALIEHYKKLADRKVEDPPEDED
ncbi:MAG: hypothetical protein UT05_C0007G0030 [Parcubacteria group bacterium GW2011_GWF2_38_76]|nr:MAG: hypothetical protein UT05_C0007G0030 [Parcubacteria group bacterium GW2011_GWF2_38_76]HBM46094.1 hypothetical protein [Patescibacteria group bacterium]